MTIAMVEGPDVAFTQHWLLDHLPISRRFSVYPAESSELPALMEMTVQHIPGLRGSYSDAVRVHDHSSSIIAVRDGRGLAGSYAFLFLNRAGLEALLDGSFPIGQPDPRLLCRAEEKAAALYAWAMCLPGPVVGAMGNIMDLLRRPAHAQADLYARPGTEKGERFMTKTGFRPLGDPASSLWVYRRPKAFEQAAE